MKSLTTTELRALFLRFFGERGHTIIPSASLIPENDPTVLFTTAGMHPLMPYLMGAAHKFKGGLAEATDETAKLHTATHLLQAALRKVLDESVAQRGSNITAERLRFDFSFPRKVTPEELREVEKLVNEAIDAGVDITCEEMTVPEARARGAIGLFGDKYGERVKVYTMGDYSCEICGGPHAANTGDLGTFKIKKEEASSAGVRRIKAVLIPKEEKKD